MYITLSPTEQWHCGKGTSNTMMNDREARPRELMQVEVTFRALY